MAPPGRSGSRRVLRCEPRKLNFCHESAAETSSSLQKGHPLPPIRRHFVSVLLSPPHVYFIARLINCFGTRLNVCVCFLLPLWKCHLSGIIKMFFQKRRELCFLHCTVNPHPACIRARKCILLNVPCTNTLVGRGGVRGGEPRVADRSWHGVNSFNDGKAGLQFVCVCARLHLPGAYWSCARGRGELVGKRGLTLRVLQMLEGRRRPKSVRGGKKKVPPARIARV